MTQKPGRTGMDAEFPYGIESRNMGTKLGRELGMLSWVCEGAFDTRSERDVEIVRRRAQWGPEFAHLKVEYRPAELRGKALDPA